MGLRCLSSGTLKIESEVIKIKRIIYGQTFDNYLLAFIFLIKNLSSFNIHLNFEVYSDSSLK